MVSHPAETATRRIRGWLGAHVEARALHTAGELRLLDSLLQEPSTPQTLAETLHCEPYAVRVVLDILTTLEIVSRESDGRYRLTDALQSACDQRTMQALATAARGWQSLSAFVPTTSAALVHEAREAAASQGRPEARLLACAWGYVWSAGLMEAGAHRLLSALQERPLPFAELARERHLAEEDLRQLCMVGQQTGVLSQVEPLVELSPEARRAFGQGSVKEYCRWMEQRLVMERSFFYTPLGHLSRVLQDRQPASQSSSLGNPANDLFRRTFVRVNRPLIPLLYHVAQKVAADLPLAQQPIRLLEVGAASGCWGLALAAAHPHSQVVAVDTAEVLQETQQVVDAAKARARYTWAPGSILHLAQQTQAYDLIVLNEVCHTIPPEQLVPWLTRIVQMLADDGLLLIADMVLDEDEAGPARHLLSALRLLVTGGGRLLNFTDYRRTLQQAGVDAIQFSRLATTDLILAARRTDQLQAT